MGRGNRGVEHDDQVPLPGIRARHTSTAPIQWTASRAGRLRKFRLLHRAPAGNGNSIVYTLRKNGVATAAVLTLASTGSAVSDLVTEVTVAAGDKLDWEVTKALTIATSPSDVTLTAEYTY